MRSQRKTKVPHHSILWASGDGPADHTAVPGSDDWLPPKVLLKPVGQLVLTEADLGEELTRILNANNPHAPHNIARYNHKDRVFKASPNVDHLVVHFEFDGYLVFKGGDDTQQTASTGTTTAPTEDAASSAVSEQPVAEGGEAPEPEEKKPAKNPTRNQFNFSERAAQTINNPFRDRSTNTEPPPARTFSETVNQWSIYDAYVEDLLHKEKAAKEKSKAPQPGGKGHKEEDKGNNMLQSEGHGGEEVYYKSVELRKAITIIERMANQNTFDDIAEDYKYWEDASDELREGKTGTLLPLWKFVCEKEKRKQVTAICCSPKFRDLFAIGYGSYDFSKQGPGMIACFTLKNPSYPEFLYVTESGVMCLDIHPQHPSMIAVGLFDGSVCVYNLQKKSDHPVFKSLAGKHTDSVWQICWQKDDLDENMNFSSVSSDGRVTQWTLVKNELVYTDIIKLEHQSALLASAKPALTDSTSSSEGSANAATQRPILKEEEKLFGKASGLCFDFNKSEDDVFVVGTEEGQIHKCSKAYNSQYLLTFEGHQMGVYMVRYNKFNTKILLSASSDWTVKLWDHNLPKPIMTFDLNSPVGDVAWAPYSSTVFAAATGEGKVFVFDLDINKYEPICEQRVVRKTRLTHIAFNPFEPIILVGDEKGNVLSLKLSPNLRRVPTGRDADNQSDRLEHILLIAMGKSD
ncbi:WD40-repeat-containing domain protein [Cladochytrium replicatum]|nr:WD40-repeat-containing domain protein [Cladochytrium replicatum]